MLDCLRCHHLTHICSSGWITDHSCSSTDQCDWFISCFLQTFHQTQCHEMSYVKAVCCRVKSDVECSLSIVDQVFDPVFVCYLCDQTSCNEFFINSHFYSPFIMLMIYRILTLLQLANILFRKQFSHITGQKKSLSNQYWIRTILTVVPPYFADYLRIQPHSICVFTDLCTITCARRHSLLSKTLIILIVYHFGVQLQDVFILHSFMRLSSTGSFLYGCVNHYFFFSKPL